MSKWLHNDNKAHTRKGKSLVEFSAKTIFFHVAKRIQILLFTVKISFFAFYHLRWDDVAHQAAQLKYQ